MFKILLTKLSVCGRSPVGRKIKNPQINFDSRCAFTLVELLTVISITVVITAVGFVTLSRYKGSQSIRLTLDEISTAMLDARNKSISQLNGSAWGVHFENNSSVQKYEIFEGSDYASSTKAGTYPLTEGVQFSNPFSSSTIDLSFAKVTGALSSSQIISIIDGKGDNLVGDFIVTSLGSINQRFEKGLVGYWHFDENSSSTVYDASGSGNTGILYDSSIWTSSSNCKAGSCLSFNGSTNYIDVGTVGNYTDNFSLSAWVKHTNTSGWDDIIAGSCGDFLFAFSNTTFQFGGQCNNPFGMTTYSGNIEGAWHYVAATYDGSTVTLYVDGLEVSSSTKSGVFVPSNLYIGGGSSERFLGSIDEVRIYNRTLSSSEILGQYNDLK